MSGPVEDGVQLVIAARLPSLNEFVDRHWAVSRRLKATWRMLLAHALIVDGRRWQAEHRPVCCDLLRVVPSRRQLLDHDNLWGGAKKVVDAMKELGWIVDDSPTWLTLQVDQEIQNGGPAWTRVRLRYRR